MQKSTLTGNFFALMLIISMFAFNFYFPPIQKILPQNTIVILIAGRLIMFGIPMAVFFTVTKEPAKNVFFLNYISPVNIILIFLISIIIQPILMTVSALSSFFVPNAAASYLEEMNSLPSTAALFITSVLPAFLEELYFRGIILSNYTFVSQTKSCLFVGLLFGMAHLNGQQFFYVFLMGTIFCYFVIRTGSIFSSILSHLVINGSQTILSAMVMRSAPQVSQSAEAVSQSLQSFMPLMYFALLTLIPLAALIYIFDIINRNPKKFHIQNTKITFVETFPKQKVINWPFVTFAVIFLYYIFI